LPDLVTSQIYVFVTTCVLDLAFWNCVLAEAVGGKANPYGKKQETIEQRDDVKTKAALRRVVEESYDNLLAASEWISAS
jgi:hypothetical protein